MSRSRTKAAPKVTDVTEVAANQAPPAESVTLWDLVVALQDEADEQGLDAEAANDAVCAALVGLRDRIVLGHAAARKAA